MPRVAEVIVDLTAGLVNFNGGGYAPPVQLPGGTLYAVYIDSLSDVVFRKSTDGGLTWTAPTVIFAGTATAVAVWYEKWSGNAGGLIHVCYAESATDDVLYRNIDTTSSDALSTQTSVFAGTSTAGGGALAICEADADGYIGVMFNIDAGAEDGFARSTDNGATWASRSDMSEAATQDQYIMAPQWGSGDAQDMMLIFWDASADELSRKNYDESANSNAETSIATSMVDQVATTAFPHFSLACDHVNSRNVLVAWSAVDGANADLRCWTITSSAITEVTNVVQNGTDDQGCAAIAIDDATGYWHVFYVGKSDGSETFPTAVNIYSKVSKDAGSTWGPETVVTNSARTIRSVYVPQHFDSRLGPCPVFFHNDQTQVDEIRCVAQKVMPRAGILIGG